MATLDPTVTYVYDLPGTTKKVTRHLYTQTANGSGAWATVTLEGLYGYIADIQVTVGGTAPDATLSCALYRSGKVGGDYLMGSVSGVDFTGSNTNFFSIPGQTASSVTAPSRVLLLGDCDLVTTSANTTASAVYTFSVTLVSE